MDKLRRSYAIAVARRVIARAQKASETGIEQIPMAGLFMPLHPKEHAEPPLPKLGNCPIEAKDNARSRLWQALEGLCGICGHRIETLAEVTYDHVTPRSRGGGNYGNLVPAHSACNGAKGDRMPFGCELIMLDALNARAGNVVAELLVAKQPSAIMASAFARAGL